MPQKLPKIIGITGGIGSGKTLVSTIFQELGVPVYNSDNSAKTIITENTDVKQAIKNLLGVSAYTNLGEYNTRYVKEKVFSQPELLTKLNNIVHPAVAVDFQKWHKEQTSAYVIKESALLLQSDLSPYYKVIFCQAKEEERIQRILERDPERSLSEVKHILNIQNITLPKSDKLLILNNNNEQPIVDTILNWHKSFLN